MTNNIYIVKQEQVGHRDVSDFLREAINIQFQNIEFFIAAEQTLDTVVPYTQGKRRLRVFQIQDNTNNTQHNIAFDVTDVTIHPFEKWLHRE